MIYLLHFKTPFKHAKHYIGFVEKAEGLDARIKKHASGSGSKLMSAVSKAGIEFVIARLWPDGDRNFERHLKNRKDGPQICPICNPRAMNKALTVPKSYTPFEESPSTKSIPCDGITVAIDSEQEKTHDQGK